MRLVAVIGAPGSGKTTCLSALVARLRARGLDVGGILQPALEQGGARQGYELLDVASGARRAFARRAAPNEEGASFVLDEEGFAWAGLRLLAARAACDVVVVDELGRLEGRGNGHVPALRAGGVRERARAWVLGVRADVAGQVASWLGDFDFVAAPSREPATIDEWAARIARS